MTLLFDHSNDKSQGWALIFLNGYGPRIVLALGSEKPCGCQWRPWVVLKMVLLQ
ncbi:hypothetical protein D082_31580 [Synechocystis sp. PCC 6714]|nr:hypothetical protein D082_31580 [Synechocystis sp. PCC 6714]